MFVLQANDATAETATIDALRQHLAGKRCVIAGQSGVGKSSTVRALFPHFAPRIGAVSDVQHKGKHTTIASRSYALPTGGALVDTPGVRECAIGGIEPLSLALLYPEFAERHHNCRFHNCQHLHEPDCAIIKAVSEGHIARSRYESFEYRDRRPRWLNTTHGRW